MDEISDFKFKFHPHHGLPPQRGAGLTLGVELRSTAEVYPPPKLRRSSIRFPGSPAKGKPCQKHHRLAELVARWPPDP
ncbi:unnamed protein product [Strongylus vulgaris]|uniref:Uncharacterized protein n=1 Tax=Strongylus vulgaris TaxID=40348 RepID=A0A3P7IWM1_STRVU|nr:unnamed protein product [Strongylus vulgaris]